MLIGVKHLGLISEILQSIQDSSVAVLPQNDRRLFVMLSGASAKPPRRGRISV